MKQSNFKLGRPANSQNSSKSKKVILVILTLVLVAAGVTAWVLMHKNTEPKPDNSAETTTKQIEADKNGQNTSEDTANLPDNSGSITPQDVPTSTTLSVETPSFSQSGGVVNTSAKVAGINSEGTCVITFKNVDDRPIIRQINSVKQVCSTSISEVEFQKIGTWNLNVTFYNGNTKAEANRDVTIN